MADRYIPFSSPEESDPYQFLNKAINLVRETVIARNGTSKKFEVYVVWFSKTLQNWKACLSTDIPDGKYYEVTYDGDKGCAYVDIYGKISQDVVWDDLRDLMRVSKENLEKSRDERIAENEAVANSEGMRFGNIKSIRAETPSEKIEAFKKERAEELGIDPEDVEVDYRH